ncbi:MAG: SIS domain-containing protein [Fimbriimonadaceae bacterium]
MHTVLARAFDDGEKLLREFRTAEPDIRAVIAVITTCFGNGGKVFTAGNGGSMADAMHVAEEFTGRFKKDRPALPAIALADPTHLTCVSNDYGFEFVFSRPIEALGKPGDVVLLLTTSGNSENLIKAAEAATARGCLVVGFLGKGGGKLRSMCDLVVMAPGDTSDRIQELHMFALHAIIEAVEIELGYE